jgi:hypothetical protein
MLAALVASLGFALEILAGWDPWFIVSLTAFRLKSFFHIVRSTASAIRLH